MIPWKRLAKRLREETQACRRAAEVWRGVSEKYLARSVAAEEAARDWHNLADDRSSELVRQMARIAELEASLEEELRNGATAHERKTYLAENAALKARIARAVAELEKVQTPECKDSPWAAIKRALEILKS